MLWLWCVGSNTRSQALVTKSETRCSFYGSLLLGARSLTFLHGDSFVTKISVSISGYAKKKHDWKLRSCHRCDRPRSRTFYVHGRKVRKLNWNSTDWTNKRSKSCEKRETKFLLFRPRRWRVLFIGNDWSLMRNLHVRYIGSVFHPKIGSEKKPTRTFIFLFHPSTAEKENEYQRRNPQSQQTGNKALLYKDESSGNLDRPAASIAILKAF